jgi:hypothetical protein
MNHPNDCPGALLVGGIDRLSGQGNSQAGGGRDRDEQAWEFGHETAT